MDYREQLLAMIERLVSGEWSVPEFERNYYMFQLDEVPEATLSDARDEFFSMVREKLDWTGPAPDAESRSHGWMDHEEYRAWVTQEFHRYRGGRLPGWQVE